MHAALGDERQAETHLGAADELLADGLGADVPEWVSYFDAAELAGARAVSPETSLVSAATGQRAFTSRTRALRKPGFDRVKVMYRVGLAATLFDEG
ncbi:hypothetical protein [Streptomyces mirabilis]|uniref:hypothetical protein n=1 Tax=Streptomyces mirabilis TaxID=68239 RepID=UPI0036E6E34D